MIDVQIKLNIYMIIFLLYVLDQLQILDIYVTLLDIYHHTKGK
jgi:hypothetical protein